jgi:hypothetical protein
MKVSHPCLVNDIYKILKTVYVSVVIDPVPPPPSYAKRIINGGPFGYQ